MTDHAQIPEPDEQPRLQVPGEVVERSKLIDRRPAVSRLRAVRTGEASATLYVGWPENSDTLALAPRVYEQARALAQAIRREDRLLEDPLLEVELLVHAEGPELEGPSVVVLMDLSDLPLAEIEMHFTDMETNEAPSSSARTPCRQAGAPRSCACAPSTSPGARRSPTSGTPRTPELVTGCRP
jgi:hypothetical protein